MDLGTDFNHALKTARIAASAGRAVLNHHFGQIKSVSEKSYANLVSEADLASEEVIVKELNKWKAGVRIWGEEGSPNAFSQANEMEETSAWIIDPLDGTSNYIFGVPAFAISIALMIKGKIEVGVIDLPPLNRTYWAVRGQGAYMNERPLRVSERKELRKSMLATGFFHGDPEILERQLKWFASVSKCSLAVRRMGAAAMDLALVAEGVFDGFWESGLKPWDTGAGSLLVTEAGGQISTIGSGSWSVTSPTVVATNGKIHKDLDSILTESN